MAEYILPYSAEEIEEKLGSIDELANGLAGKELTEAEFNSLSEEEQNNGLYFITDGVYEEVNSYEIIGTYTSKWLYGATGYVTTSGKAAYIDIPMNWAKNVSNVTISSIKCSMRHVAGGYLGGSDGIDLTSYITSIAVSKEQGILTIGLTNDSGWSITNNTPLCGHCVISYTAS